MTGLSTTDGSPVAVRIVRGAGPSLVGIVVLLAVSGCSCSQRPPAQESSSEQHASQNSPTQDSAEPSSADRATDSGQGEAGRSGAEGDPADRQEKTSGAAARDGGVGGVTRASNGSASGSGGDAPRAESPSQAARKARRLFEQARQEAERGEASAAFLKARDAWELARQYPDDEACSDLAERIFGSLDDLAGRANAQAGDAARGSDRILIEQ